MTINANEVKKHGVSIFDKLLDKFDQLYITFRGKRKYVVMDIERYEELRKKELELAYREVMEDVARGDYHTDIERHLREIDNV